MYRNGSRLEYADSLQKTGSGSGVDWSMPTVYRIVVVVVVVEWSGLDWIMQTVYRRVVVVVVMEWSGLEYADCLQKNGSGVEWTGVCRLFTEEW